MASRQFRSDDTSTWIDRYGAGTDGAYSPSTGTDSPIDSAASGTSGTTSLTATNTSFAAGQLILIHQTQGTGAGNWELNKISSYVAGTITLTYPLVNSYGTGSQVIVMPSYSSGSIAGGVTITGKAWNGTVGGICAKICNGTFSIAGTIDVIDIGFRKGPTISNSNGQGYQGEGSAGAGTQSKSANGNGAGGGQDGTNAPGSAGAGGGGNASAGSNGQNGTAAGASGGNAVGIANLTTMFFGGAGGNVAHDGGDGLGSNGGGIVIIIAPTITVTGLIKSNSAASTLSPTIPTIAGGTGAGGSILLKGNNITLGTTLITAIAATVPTGGESFTSGQGSVGRIHADYGTSISGTTNPTIDSRQDSSLVPSVSGLSQNNAFFM